MNVMDQLKEMLAGDCRTESPLWMPHTGPDGDGRLCFIAALVRSCCDGGAIATAELKGDRLMLEVIRLTSGPSGSRTAHYAIQGQRLPVEHTGMNSLMSPWRKAATKYWAWRKEHTEIKVPLIENRVSRVRTQRQREAQEEKRAIRELSRMPEDVHA